MKVRIRETVIFAKPKYSAQSTLVTYPDRYTNYRVSVDGKYVDSFLTMTRAKRFVKERYADVAKQDLVIERRI